MPDFKMPIASFNWTLQVDCVHCKKQIDLEDQDADGYFSGPIFTNKWDDLKDAEVNCPHCGGEFLIGGIVY